MDYISRIADKLQQVLADNVGVDRTIITPKLIQAALNHNMTLRSNVGGYPIPNAPGFKIYTYPNVEDIPVAVYYGDNILAKVSAHNHVHTYGLTDNGWEKARKGWNDIRKTGNRARLLDI